MYDTKSIPIEEPIERNQSLHDAGRIAFDIFHRYQHNIKKIRALARSIARMDASDKERMLLISAMNDAIGHAETEVDAEMPYLMTTLARGNGVQDRDSTSTKILH